MYHILQHTSLWLFLVWFLGVCILSTDREWSVVSHYSSQTLQGLFEVLEHSHSPVAVVQGVVQLGVEGGRQHRVGLRAHGPGQARADLLREVERALSVGGVPQGEVATGVVPAVQARV